MMRLAGVLAVALLCALTVCGQQAADGSLTAGVDGIVPFSGLQDEYPPDYTCIYTSSQNNSGHPTIKRFAPHKMNFTNIQCPMYEDRACCDQSQNTLYFVSFLTLKSDFGDCYACYLNLVELFCSLSCSPDQLDFMTLHGFISLIPPGNVEPRTVLNTTVRLHPEFACAIGDSCRHTSTASEVTALQSTVGMLNYFSRQAETHGTHYNWVFTETNSLRPPHIRHCSSYYDPRSQQNASCSCATCPQTCSAFSGNIAPLQLQGSQVKVLHGISAPLLGGTLGAIGVAALLLVWYRYRARVASEAKRAHPLHEPLAG